MRRSGNNQENGILPPDVVKRKEKVISQLQTISVTTDFTQKLASQAPIIFEETLSKFSLPFHHNNLPQTFFIPQKNIWAAEKIIGESLVDSSGTFLPTLGTALVIMTGDPILDAHAFFHENSHGLGKVAVWKSGKERASRVGYSLRSNISGRAFETGDFLEEATNDFVATMAAKLFLQNQNIALPSEKPERYIAEYSGGRPYSHMRDCLIFLSKNIPELLPLFIRARFDSSEMHPLMHTLHTHYGRGAMQTLNRMHSSDPLLNDELIMMLKQGER